MKVSIDGLGEEIKKQLEDWHNKELKSAVNKGLEETAKEAADELKKGGAYKERTGKYTKDWTYRKRNSRKAVITGLNGYSVYNKKNYQLTHLLEKGHQLRRGGRAIGRVRAFEHIAPVNEAAGDLAVEKIKQKIEG